MARSTHFPMSIRSLSPFLTLPLLASLGLVACVDLKPSSRTAVSLPAEWKNAAGFTAASPSRDLSRWWGRFGDPVLTRLISTSVSNSPDLASAASRVREARARRQAEATILLPFVSGSTGANASNVLRDGARDTSSTTFSAGLNASWEADIFGKNRTSLLATGAGVDATVESLHTAQASLASEVALAYLSLRSSQARLSVVRDSLKSREETFELTTWRQKAGQIDDLEMRQAEASLEQSRAAIPSLEQSIAQTRNRLTLLAGLSPGSLDGMLGAKGREIPSPPSGLAVGIPADTIRQRPDVRAAGYQWVAAVYRTRAAKLEKLPSLSLSGSLGTNTVSFTKLFNPDAVSTGLVAGLSGPIFDAGRIRANIEAQDAVEEQALLAYSSTVLQSLSEVEDSLIACRRTAERIVLLEKAAIAAREAAILARQRYRAGVVDILTVLDAERTELAVEESLILTRADRSASYVQLYKALGGGWSAGS